MAASEVPLGELRTQNGITDDGYDHHSLHGTLCFEVTEKNNDLLNGILKLWKYLFRS